MLVVSLHGYMVAYDENLMKMYITTILKPLTLHPASAPPPPHTMVVFTVLPHQSLWVQVEWPTRGRYACFSWADRGPPAAKKTTANVCFTTKRPELEGRPTSQEINRLEVRPHPVT